MPCDSSDNSSDTINMEQLLTIVDFSLKEPEDNLSISTRDGLTQRASWIFIVGRGTVVGFGGVIQSRFTFMQQRSCAEILASPNKRLAFLYWL